MCTPSTLLTRSGLAAPVTRGERGHRTEELLAAVTALADRDPALTARCRTEVVLLNLSVAEAVALRYRHRGIDDDDLRQLGYEGLVKATRRYQPELGPSFLSFAVPTVRGEVRRYFRDHGWTVRPPRRVQELQWRANQAVPLMSQLSGRDPTASEICAHLGVSRRAYDEAEQAYGAFAPLSLDAPVGPHSDQSAGDLIPDAGAGQAAAEVRLDLIPAVRGLSERDRYVLYLRFYEDRTQQEIGDELGVTQMQISRRLQRIFHQLKTRLSDSSEAG